MNNIVIASVREGAGKTSMIIGLMSALDKKFGYLKPFGDRLIYRRKRNWDYDSSLIVDIFNLREEAEDITLGFNHSKLRYVHDEVSIEQSLDKMMKHVTKDKDILLIEGGMDLTYGASLDLDSLSVARYTNSKLVLVLSGNNDSIMDDIRFINKYIDREKINFGGVIINKVKDIDEFEDLFLMAIEEMDIKVYGIVPYREHLTYFSIKYLTEKLYAKVIAGEEGINNAIKNIFVGAMSTDESMRHPLFNKENKFLITSGDRSDMIVAALESDTVGILLTNNILPPANIISLAADKKIPLLLVTDDTFEVATRINSLDALMTKDDGERYRILSQLASKYIDVDALFG
jgi:BioD-like phosphotransacetylase family protein